MSNPPKIRIVCSHCRSESVTRDANASWNPDTQDWELEGVMDAAYCNDCGGECSLEEVPYRPRREITAAGFNGGTDATDDRVLWVEADSLEQIEQAVAGLGAQVHGDPACEAGEIEFHLPTDHEALRAKLQHFLDTPPPAEEETRNV